MYYKNSPIIIIILIVIVIGVGIFGYKLLIANGQTDVTENGGQYAETIPVLQLTVNTEEPNQENVTITAVATTEDPAGITSITLPDGNVSRTDNLTYVANQSGVYIFRVKGANGQTAVATIEINNVREVSAANPYIPAGFSHAYGDTETGFVIKDNYGNEYVWVPVPDGKMIRNTMLDDNYEEEASVIVNSVAQNYGFYIGKYEASKYNVNGQAVAASMENARPWTDITYIDAANVASKVAGTFGYEGVQTTIANSFAWDTTLSWIDKSHQYYSTNTGHGNYSGEIRKTGTTESDIKNNICDMAGNVREWTMELYKGATKNTNTNTAKKNNKNKNKTNEVVVEENVNYRVIRGGSANLSRTASSHTGYKENTANAYWGFRVILYK